MRLYGLKSIRKAAGKTQRETAGDLRIPLGTYRNWEQLKASPRSEELVLLADLFGCSTDTLFGRGAIWHKSVPVTVFKVYEHIAPDGPAGGSVILDELEIPATMGDMYPQGFFMVVVGDSMNREILDGHYVLVDPDAEIHNGDTVAVSIGGCDAFLKVWHKTSTSLVLSPNSTYSEHKDIIIDQLELESMAVKVLGKVVWATYPTPLMSRAWATSKQAL